MGKPTGFLEFPRELPQAHPPAERIRHWEEFHAHADEFRARHWPKGIPESDGLSRAVADFITGMTDRYALRVYEEYFLPRRWPVY